MPGLIHVFKPGSFGVDVMFVVFVVPDFWRNTFVNFDALWFDGRYFIGVVGNQINLIDI